MTNPLFYAVVFCYTIGLIFDRLGALIVYSLSKYVIARIPHVHFHCGSYEDFVRAKKSDKEIEILSEKNNLYRNMVALFLGIILDNMLNGLGNLSVYIFYGVITIIFWSSYFKQRQYIVKRIELITDEMH